MLTSENLSEGNAQSDMDISIFVPPATSVTQEGTSRQNGLPRLSSASALRRNVSPEVSREMIALLRQEYFEESEERASEMAEKGEKQRFRSILYTEGELRKSNLSEPPSRSNPHPFSPEHLPPSHSRSLAPYVNHVPLLQKLVLLGVDLFEVGSTELNWLRTRNTFGYIYLRVETKYPAVPRHLLRLSYMNVRRKLRWLVSIGVAPSDLGDYLTRNPFFLLQDLNDMKARVNYLLDYKFTEEQVVKLIITFRYWLNVDVKTMDERFIWLRKTFGFKKKELRAVLVKEPLLLMFGIGQIDRLFNLFTRELGFDKRDVEQLLMDDPRLFIMDVRVILSNYVYATRVMSLPNSALISHPFILRVAPSSLRTRHEFLRRLGKAKYVEAQGIAETLSKEGEDGKRTSTEGSWIGAEAIAMDTLIQPGDNEDLTRERQKASFSLRRMQCFVHENEHVLKRRHEILEFVNSMREFDDPVPPEFLNREELVERGTRKAVAMSDNADAIDGSDFFGEGMYYQSLIIGRDLHSMSLHYAMFLPTIQGQSDDEQMDAWMGPTVARAILGTFAQTELGHERYTRKEPCCAGSNLSKLETTATYDPDQEEFVLHSPTITAAKWWPGGLGKSCNHAVVMAQLYTRGKCHGPHPFFVQLRDEITHLPLKGITVGDIGPKLGINAADNGFLLFDNCRIPRRNMFMRFSKVLPSGEYVPPMHAKLGFGTMIFTRSIMIKDQATQLGCAAVIAIRYSAVRRQGEIIENAGEVQVIEYRTQQLRLFPQLARSFVFLFAAYEIKDLYMEMTDQISTGKTEMLPEIHAQSSGLKAVVSWEAAQGIEQCRLGCGGHGYSRASGLPDIYAYTVGGCTYEGENIVLLLQVARFLMKCAQAVSNGEAKLAHIAEYIGQRNAGRGKTAAWSQTKWEDIIHDYEHVSRKLIFRAFNNLKKREGRMNAREAWNETSIDLCKASRVILS